MILDELSELNKYEAVHLRFAAAFDYILNTKFDNMPVGKKEIDGKNILAIISDEVAVPMVESCANFECHNTYIDIQVCFNGVETVGWKSRSTCVEPRGTYDKEKDVLFFEDAPDHFFKLHPGQFGIYFPNDVHAPMIGEGRIRKLIMKVKLD
jgi:YhcH/YjgK/YiaL family protein